MTYFLYCFPITGSCKKPSKKPKGGSKPFLSKCLEFHVINAVRGIPCTVCMDKSDLFLYHYAITGSRKQPSKKSKDGSNGSAKELESKPFLSECLDFLVFVH